MAGSKVKAKVTSPSKFEFLPFSKSISSAIYNGKTNGRTLYLVYWELENGGRACFQIVDQVNFHLLYDSKQYITFIFVMIMIAVMSL